MDNYKKELIARIEHYILSKGYKKSDWYHGIYYKMPDGKDLMAISWDNQTADRGKMFFDCFENYMKFNEKHSQPLAEECSIEVLEGICKKYEMPLYSGFFTDTMWNELHILDWDEMSWGQQNIFMEVVHTKKLHDKAVNAINKRSSEFMGNLHFLGYACDLFEEVIKQMYKETKPDKPECLENESVISLMGGLKNAMHYIMQK